MQHTDNPRRHRFDCITMVSDLDGEVMNAYGVSHPNHVALRDSFLIGKKVIVRHQVVNDLPPG